MKISVLASSGSWYLRDLQRAAGTQHQLVPTDFSSLRSLLDADHEHLGSETTNLHDFDCLLVRTMPPGSLEQVVFRMDVLQRWEAAGGLVVNPPRAIEAAVDKYLASAKLQAAGLPTPRTFVCQTVDDAMQGFADFGGDVVVKPLFGSEGRGITRLTDEALALRAFKMLVPLGAVLYLQEYVAHEGFDLRLLVVGQRVLGMRRYNRQDWRTNISRGAQPDRLEVSPALASLAQRAAAAVGASLAGVDVLTSGTEKQYVIEVNAVPGWKSLSRVLHVDVAKMVLEHLESLSR